MNKVNVYTFVKYDIVTDKDICSKRMATLEAIKNFGCFPLMDTAKEVDMSELDDSGRYTKNKS